MLSPVVHANLLVHSSTGRSVGLRPAPQMAAPRAAAPALEQAPTLPAVPPLRWGKVRAFTLFAEHLWRLRLDPAPPPSCWLHFDPLLWQSWSLSWPALKPAVGSCSSGAGGTVLPRFLAAVFV